jgi:hypothetical protein
MSTATAPADDDRHDGLLGWQHRLYPGNHTKRSTLVLHAITSPLFCLGELALVAAIVTSPWVALGGLGIPLALIAQGRAHKGEPVRPVPFRGPADFVARFVVEQWVTFPRWVLNGGFGKAWRAAK